MTTKYITSSWLFGDVKIIPVEIIKETEKMILIKGENTMRKKRATFETYHDTWNEAHQFLLRRAQDGVTATSKAASDAVTRFAQVQAMRHP